MTCPRCGTEWDVSKSPCSRCGLLVRLPNNLRSTTRNASSGQNQQGPSSSSHAIPGDFSTAPPPADINPSVGSPSSPQYRKPFQSGVFPEMPDVSLPSQWQQTGSMPIMGAPTEQGSAGTSLSEGRGSIDSRTRQNRTPGLQNADSLSQAPFARSSEPTSQKSVPSRPQTPLPPGQTQASTSDPAQALRARRLVTNAEKGETQARSVNGGVWETKRSAFVSSGLNENPAEQQVRPLVPGTLLRNKRYQLRELLNRQEWQTNVYEATWLAHDAQRGGAQVNITELVVPESSSMSIQSLLRTATMVLTSAGRHAHVPTLWDAFSDQDRNFFVFEPVEGESLYARMRQSGRALSEQDVIDYCMQMADVLELLAQQIPPMVHGLIRPEHIIMSYTTNQYILTNFSVILAGGGTQFISGIDHARLSPYMSPEFARGIVDTRSDLYSLIASAYHTATGSIPAAVGPIGTVTSAQRLNPNISAQLDQVLSKGLRPIAVQRYQKAAELRFDLFAIRAANGSLMEKSVSVSASQNPATQSFSQLVQTQTTPPVDTVAQMLPNMLATEFSDSQERKLLLPRPEDLPPMVERNDTQLSLLWLLCILVCLTVIVVLSRVLS